MNKTDSMILKKIAELHLKPGTVGSGGPAANIAMVKRVNRWRFIVESGNIGIIALILCFLDYNGIYFI
jgi:chromate transport protein ChrA